MQEKYKNKFKVSDEVTVIGGGFYVGVTGTVCDVMFNVITKEFQYALNFTSDKVPSGIVLKTMLLPEDCLKGVNQVKAKYFLVELNYDEYVERQVFDSKKEADEFLRECEFEGKAFIARYIGEFDTDARQ